MTTQLTSPPRLDTGLLPVVYCYSGAEWNDYPGRQFAFMQAMSRQTDVYFLNRPTIKGRLVEFSHPTAEKIADGLTVIHDAFTFRTCRVGKHLEGIAGIPDSLAFHRFMRERGVDKYIYWLSTPMKSLLHGMHLDNLVYDCIDPAPDNDLHNRLHNVETMLADRSTAVLCTAENLQTRLLPSNPRCYLVPNAAGARDFPEAGPREIPEPLRHVRGPIVGYTGTVDFRIDHDLLIAAAQRLPEITFAIAGHIKSLSPESIETLRKMPNVILPGNITHEESRAYIAAFDLGIIPFNPGIMGDGINPVKMYMYLAAGKPVVSTWMQECLRHAPLVSATRNADEFVAAIQRELASDTPEKAAERIAFARKNTWEDRAAQVAGIFTELGLRQ